MRELDYDTWLMIGIAWVHGLLCGYAIWHERKRSKLKDEDMNTEDDEFNRIEREAAMRKRDDDDYVETAKERMFAITFQQVVRNHTLEEVAQEFDKMKSLGDTAASFAAYVRNMKA